MDVLHGDAAPGGRFGVQDVQARFLGHAHAVVRHAHDNVVAFHLARHADGELAFRRHGMAHGVLHERLDEEGRHHHVVDVRLDVHFHGYPVLAETRDLERKVAFRLLYLAREQDEVGGVFQRAAVEHGELAQQDARLLGVRADERGDGVDGVEQEMRVDLALQRLQLHAGGQLRLLLQRRSRHLGGQKLAETLGDGLLRLGDMTSSAVIELQRALHRAAHHQRDDDGGLDGGRAGREADLLRCEQDTTAPIGERGMGCVRADNAAGGVVGLLVAGVAQDMVLVGHCHGNGRRRGQQQLADALCSFAGHPLLHTVERLAGQAQHGIGLARAHGIGIHEQPDDDDEREGEHDACHDEHGDAAVRRHGRPDEHEARQHRYGEHEHLEREETGQGGLLRRFLLHLLQGEPPRRV